MAIPRAEHPRPQFMRAQWMNLNGEWQFAFDHGNSGREQGFHTAGEFQQRISVPFCPESRLSGIGYTDFMAAVWYRRTMILPEDWAGKRIMLHFGAVDYETKVWVNGQSVGKHRGGYSSFTFEITDALQPGENTIVVCAKDDVRSNTQPAGKQSQAYEPSGCKYTRTTGIWQTVWLEAVPHSYIVQLHTTPDLENGRVHLLARIDGQEEGLSFTAAAMLDGEPVGSDHVTVSGGVAQCDIRIDTEKVRAWEPGSPVLYDLRITLSQHGKIVDEATSYFGLRSLGWRGPALLLNGKPLFQRLILDQGFYPDGIYTAPTDDELRADIERSMAMGFNGARLHEKVFEERFLYWADKLGYLVWGEMANWGIDHGCAEAAQHFTAEWTEVVERDYNHPSIVGWCPFNETWDGVYTEFLTTIYQLTKRIDPTRPVIDTSGNYHVGHTDVYDAHDYDQNPVTFAERFAPFAAGDAPHAYFPDKDAPYQGQPYFISEYGGIWWNPQQHDDKAWGYGNRPTSEQEFIERYRGLTEVLLNHPRMCGFCYTQLTDVEQEVNGLYTYDRKAKFDPAIIRAINIQPAAIERIAEKTGA